MRIVQGYKGNYISNIDKRLQLLASAWQWRKFNPEDDLVLYCPREDSTVALNFREGGEKPWSDICVVPDEKVYKLYDTCRYEIMAIQDEDFGWLDPDTLTFEPVPDLIPGRIDFIGYGNEGDQNLYPKRQERWFRDFLAKFSYAYNYEEKAYNMGFFKTTAELGVLIGLECRRALDYFMNQGITYWEPSDVRLHHFCSQAVPALVIDRFHKKYREINSLYCDLDHPAVFHLAQLYIDMPNGDRLWSSRRSKERVGFWTKLFKYVVEKKGITWEEFCEFYYLHKNDEISFV